MRFLYFLFLSFFSISAAHTTGSLHSLALKTSRHTAGQDKGGGEITGKGDIDKVTESLRYFIRKNGDFSSIWAKNAKQQFTGSFDQRGLILETQSPTGELLTSRWELQTLEKMTVGPGQIDLEGPKISNNRPSLGLTEWYVNRKEGLEHGFTISNRPLITEDNLILKLSISGDLRVEASQNGQSIKLVQPEDRVTILHYSGLKVWDSKGNKLAARMLVNERGDELSYVVEDQEAVYPITIDPTFTLNQEAYLKASNTELEDRFGSAVAISGNTLVVGADDEDSASSGVNGDETDNSLVNSGAAFVYVRNGNVWEQQAYLKASNPDANDGFGGAVAISGDSIVIGAVGESSDADGVNGVQEDDTAASAGAAYVFIREGENWRQQAYLKASNSDPGDEFSASVAISGNTIVVGALGEESSALGVNGDELDNTEFQAGAVYIFHRVGDNWGQQAYLKASNTDPFDAFGTSVAISQNTVVVGANRESSSSMGVDGDQNNNDFLSSGAAYVYSRLDGEWRQEAYLKASNVSSSAEFGTSVDISDNTIVVGAPSESNSAQGVNGNQFLGLAPESGAAYIFTKEGIEWTQQAYLKASNADLADEFARQVSISGDSVLIGASAEMSATRGISGDETDNSTDSSGAAYLFVRMNNTWQQEAYLKASNTDELDLFGNDVAISGNFLIVGAPGEASSAFGVNSLESDNSSPSAGAAYVFTAVSADTTTTELAITASEVRPDGPVTFSFSADPGVTYFVEYSDDLETWTDSPFRVVADARTVQWEDSGPPITSSAPLDSFRRFYRVRQLGGSSN